MKVAGLIFIGIVFLIAFKYTKVFDVNILWIILLSALWFAVVYIGVHSKNKERETPKPVYITN